MLKDFAQIASSYPLDKHDVPNLWVLGITLNSNW